MMRSLAFTSAAALVLAGCATTPRSNVEPAPQPAVVPATAAFNPVGEYNFSVDMQGNIINGTMALTRASDGRLGGQMSSNQGTLVFRSVSMDGRRMTAKGLLDNGPELTFVLNFVTDDDFNGTFSVQGTNGNISGTRRKS